MSGKLRPEYVRVKVFIKNTGSTKASNGKACYGMDNPRYEKLIEEDNDPRRPFYILFWDKKENEFYGQYLDTIKHSSPPKLMSPYGPCRGAYKSLLNIGLANFEKLLVFERQVILV